MVNKDTNVLLILVIIFAGMALVSNPGLFTIYTLSQQVQYTNQPIEARFTLSNYSNPTIKALFNGVELYTADYFTLSNTTEEVTYVNNSIDSQTGIPINITYKINETKQIKSYPAQGQKYIYTYETLNGTYVLKLTGFNETGYFKFIVSEGNKSEFQTIEVRTPFVNIENDIRNVIDQGSIEKITLKTKTPQGNDLEAESLDIQIIKPDNSVETITPSKNGNVFTFNYNYLKEGNYIYKIKGRKAGYDSKEFTIAVSVTKNASIPLIIWIWMAAALILIILIIITLIRRS